MNKAIFLDRDGVLVKDHKNYYLYELKDFAILPNVPAALRLLLSPMVRVIPPRKPRNTY